MAVNIVKDYAWTSVPKGAPLRNEAPFAFVRAFEPEYSQLQQFVEGYINLLNSIGDGDKFYENIYKGKELDKYYFPYFGSAFRSFSNEYADTFSNISQRGAQAIGADLIQNAGTEYIEGGIGGGVAAVRELLNTSPAQKIYQSAANLASKFGINAPQQLPGSNAPGSYIETPKFYQYNNTDAPIEISFVLSNTIEDGDAEKNASFITEFTKINRPERKGAIGMTFPAIYKVHIPGLRYIEWAFLSSFSVSLLGTRRKIGDKIIPEAYGCNFSFTSLTIEAANFMNKI